MKRNEMEQNKANRSKYEGRHEVKDEDFLSARSAENNFFSLKFPFPKSLSTSVAFSVIH